MLFGFWLASKIFTPAPNELRIDSSQIENKKIETNIWLYAEDKKITLDNLSTNLRHTKAYVNTQKLMSIVSEFMGTTNKSIDIEHFSVGPLKGEISLYDKNTNERVKIEILNDLFNEYNYSKFGLKSSDFYTNTDNKIKIVPNIGIIERINLNNGKIDSDILGNIYNQGYLSLEIEGIDTSETSKTQQLYKDILNSIKFTYEDIDLYIINSGFTHTEITGNSFISIQDQERMRAESEEPNIKFEKAVVKDMNNQDDIKIKTLEPVNKSLDNSSKFKVAYSNVQVAVVKGIQGTMKRYLNLYNIEPLDNQICLFTSEDEILDILELR